MFIATVETRDEAPGRQPLEEAVAVLRRTLPAGHPTLVSTSRTLERAREM